MRLTQEDKALIDKLIQEMNKSLGTEYKTEYGDYVTRSKKGCCFWGAISEEGEIHLNGNQACHAGLAYNNFHNKAKFIASRIQWEYNPRSLPMGVVDAYLRWLTMFSPLAGAFVIKGGVKNRKRGYVVVRTDVPANYMAAALISVRQITEASGSPVLMWWHLQRNGLHPSLAYAHGYSVCCNDHENVAIANGNTHSPWNGWGSDKERIINFKNKKMVKATAPWNEGGYYSPQSTLYGVGTYSKPDRAGNYVYDHPLWDKLNEFEAQTIARQTAGQKISINPFKQGLKKKVDVNIFSEIYAKALIEFYGKDNE